MEMKNSARRTRVFVAALALGLVIGAQATGLFSVSSPGGATESAASNSPSGEERRSPGEGVGLRPANLPGISLRAKDGSRTEVAKPSPQVLAKAWEQSTIRLKYLDRCQQSGKCIGFDDSQAYSYDLDVRRQQAQEVRDFTRIALAWQTQHGGAFPEEAQKIGRYFLMTGNDDVKEAALDLMDHAPTTPENMRACLQGLGASASAPLMRDFMKSKMPSACADEANAAMCIAFIRHTMRFGGENFQKEFARRSLEITNEKTYPVLAQIERQQDPRSIKRLYFRVNRQEYQRMVRGG